MNAKEGVSRVLWVVPVLLITAFVFSPKAEAWGGHDHGYRHYPHYPYGRSEVRLPGKYLSITFGSGRVFFCEGRFYRHREHDYVVIPPPVGIVISSAPFGCHKVIIDGRIYYTYNGVYYSRVTGGYRVVEPPTTVIVDPEIVSEDNVIDNSHEVASGSFTVNIPNSNGGYTAVTLKRSGSGYVGPQGEFYPTFPRVEQLRAMYGK